MIIETRLFLIVMSFYLLWLFACNISDWNEVLAILLPGLLLVSRASFGLDLFVACKVEALKIAYFHVRLELNFLGGVEKLDIYWLDQHANIYK